MSGLDSNKIIEGHNNSDIWNRPINEAPQINENVPKMQDKENQNQELLSTFINSDSISSLEDQGMKQQPLEPANKSVSQPNLSEKHHLPEKHHCSGQHHLEHHDSLGQHNLAGQHNLLGQHHLARQHNLAEQHNLAGQHHLARQHNLAEQQNLAGQHQLIGEHHDSQQLNLSGQHHLLGSSDQYIVEKNKETFGRTDSKTQGGTSHSELHPHEQVQHEQHIHHKKEDKA